MTRSKAWLCTNPFGTISKLATLHESSTTVSSATHVQVIRWDKRLPGHAAGPGREEEADTRFPTKEQSGMALLIQQYIRRMQATRQTWSKNILEVPPSTHAAHCL